jgi:hypothetical protein
VTFEERIKLQLGELLFVNLTLAQKLEETQQALAKANEPTKDEPAE